MSPPTERLRDLELVVRAVSIAGRAVMRAFRTDQEVRQKGPDQPVTDADLEADRLIAEALLEARPDYGWLSEETIDMPARLERSRVWIVDPIDGTRSFVSGYPEFAISVGLAEDGEAVLGVLYNPARAELFWSVRSHGSHLVERWDGEEGGESGAWLNAGRRLEVGRKNGAGTSSDGASAGEARPVMLASRSEIANDEMAPFTAEWEIRPLGSSAYKMAGVAAGWGDAFLSRGPKSEWDLAAAALVVEEAGGVVTDLRGRRLRFNHRDPYVYGLLAATPALHPRLLEAARRLPAPRLERGRADVERAGADTTES